MIKYGIEEFILNYNTNKKFKKMQESLNIIKYSYAMKNIDTFVFGSDTIWNIDSDNLFKLRDIFFGNKFVNKKKISYAASFANAKYEKIQKYPDIKKGLNDFEYISVRDEYSFDIAKKICDKEVEIVCDPTLLLHKEDYNSLININEKDRYIFVYLFSDLNSEQKTIIKKFAEKNNLKIICGTKKYDWIDKRVSNSPDSFISYMNNADYVITDTFHGTIFSTIFNKNYVVINRNKKKVNDFLNKCKLNNRLIENQYIDKLLSENIDYGKVNEIVDNYRKDSIEFLNNALK